MRAASTESAGGGDLKGAVCDCDRCMLERERGYPLDPYYRNWSHAVHPACALSADERKSAKERQKYEEDNFVRLSVSKKVRARLIQIKH